MGIKKEKVCSGPLRRILPIFVLCSCVSLLIYPDPGLALIIPIDNGYVFEEHSPDGKSEEAGFVQHNEMASINGKPVDPTQVDDLLSKEELLLDQFADSYSIDPNYALSYDNIIENLRKKRQASGNNKDSMMFVSEWPESPKEEENLGEISGVSVCPVTGEKFVFHRGDRLWTETTFDTQNRIVNASHIGPIQKPTIAVITRGVISRTFGQNLFYMPHGITIDKDKNIWITDVGLHQVMKFTPDNLTTPAMVLGEKLVPGSDEKHFCKPTHVAVASNGEFFVADGYCNTRIMKFTPDGKLIKQWGRKTQNWIYPRSDAFNVPHQLALVESRDMICVADREHNRVVCFVAGLDQKYNKEEVGDYGEYQIKKNKQAKKIGKDKSKNLQYKGEKPKLDPIGKVKSWYAEYTFGAIYGLAYAPGLDRLVALSAPSSEISRSRIYLIDPDNNEVTGVIENPISPQGFGAGHALATCPGHSTLESKGDCLVVSSLMNKCSSTDFCMPTNVEKMKKGRRLWLFETNPYEEM